MDFDEIKINKDTQKFVKDISELPPEKYQKVRGMLETLERQQQAEAHLENKRGWRYMWQRTPKPYLLMLGYFVFFGSVGSFGYSAFSHASEIQTTFLIVLGIIMLAPLIPVCFLSYRYVKHMENEKRNSKIDILGEADKLSEGLRTPQSK